MRSDVPNGISPYENYSILLFWLFGANIFYTFGWALEALLNYYFKVPFWKNDTRRIFFVLGTVFSFVWMFLLTSQIR
ncbi:hypothetical protein [Kordia sp. SMS9]|uniref:hypothetical protein n=1 Tax=Kordia sp. SMS9 TaxID=2282170 RepID=UPI000E0D790F|nr:hypothetical protein [Kordia sp. SMS9]